MPPRYHPYNRFVAAAAQQHAAAQRRLTTIAIPERILSIYRNFARRYTCSPYESVRNSRVAGITFIDYEAGVVHYLYLSENNQRVFYWWRSNRPSFIAGYWLDGRPYP